jgi:superoxide dismutase, Cu-Zn family
MQMQREEGSSAVAVFASRSVKGTVVCTEEKKGVIILAKFNKLPEGSHGFHIHRAGDLRGEGCLQACDHFHVGPPTVHGGPPGTTKHRHTGDLGNVGIGSYKYLLEGLKISELYGRSFIIHADPDDYGLGDASDSHTTGHSGKRIACAIIGRIG